jgi:hypothetical protein
MMHFKSKPPEERPAGKVAALDKAETAAAGKGSKYRCHRRLKKRGVSMEKNEGVPNESTIKI